MKHTVPTNYNKHSGKVYGFLFKFQIQDIVYVLYLSLPCKLPLRNVSVNKVSQFSCPEVTVL